MNEIIDMVDRFWKFDENQQQMSSWNDKQDCLKELELLITNHELLYKKRILIETINQLWWHSLINSKQYKDFLDNVDIMVQDFDLPIKGNK